MRRPPARLTAGLLVLLTSCQQLNSAGPGRYAVTLGAARSIPVAVPYTGTWTVSGVPAWVSVSKTAGSGPISFTLTADRGAGTPLAADVDELRGTLTVTWTDPGGRTGTVRWPVSADEFKLTGRVKAGPAVQGTDVRVRAVPNQPVQAASHGMIVTYRAGAGLGAQGVTARPDRRAAATLSARGLAAGATTRLGERSAAVRVADVDGALRALRADPAVESVTVNRVLHTQATAPTLATPVEPTDQFAPLQWAYRLLGYPAVWRDMQDHPYTKAVTVAVVDSGIRYDHPDLQGRLWTPGEGALDVLEATVDTAGTGNGDGDGPDTDPTDPSTPGRTASSHGTHVTGIIAARWGDNGATAGCAACSRTGVIGATNTANVKVLPIRAIDAEGNTDIAQVAVAVRYAAGLPVTLDGTTYTNPHPAQVINLSLGGAIAAAEAQPMCDAVTEATSAGALVVAASGNGYGTTPYYPAACPDAVAVSSVTLSGGSAPRRATYSNAYPQVQLAAPGGTDYFQDATYYNGARWDPRGDGSSEPFVDAIISTGWDYTRNAPNYEVEAGTSQAAPQVSALAALLLSKGVTTDAASTLARLTGTATDLGAAGRDDVFGYGMINPVAALGAPPVSDTLGLRLQDALGRVFQPKLDAVGRFQAYLGDGTFRVIGGRDRNANGVYGEPGEPASEKTAVLGADSPAVDVGDLTP
ncbi:subtilisin family serine protease [Deinococcus metalli]|uniref:Serine protease n=1 Tax=Deinococcus metalli TaxID=1141878 RepID=A0A7W8KCD2_9DEIO|nr:S8 family serine peptidase [Deinococcus metalli]MBB5375315.1 subtilisin family serine protease [Deinococcus metalli]GHF30162.1 serine protease [Deinococcus metalli]